MGKGKTGVWTAIFSAELGRPEIRWAAPASIDGPFAPQRFPLRRGSLTTRRISFAAQAALFTALAATVSIAALADKGGRGHSRGVPNVNLGVAELHRARAGVGPFVPSAVSGTARLTPSSGLLPPGHLETPGLRLGRGHSAGSPPGLTATPGVVSPPGIMETPQPGDGFGLRHSGNKLRPGPADGLKVPEAESARILSSGDAPASGQPGSGEAFPRLLPTCR